MDEIMDEKSEKLLENLKSLRKEHEPLFIVGHSMGGLLVKKIMLKGENRNFKIEDHCFFH